MNGFKVHKQAVNTLSGYSSGTDDQIVAPGAYRLVTWVNAFFISGWELDTTNNALICKTPGIKMFRGQLFNQSMTSGGTQTIKIVKNDTLATTANPTGSDTDAMIKAAGGTTDGIIFGAVDEANAGDWYRVWYFGNAGGNITIQGHSAHTMFEAIDNGGGYNY